MITFSLTSCCPCCDADGNTSLSTESLSLSLDTSRADRDRLSVVSMASLEIFSNSPRMKVCEGGW